MIPDWWSSRYMMGALVNLLANLNEYVCISSYKTLQCYLIWVLIRLLIVMD